MMFVCRILAGCATLSSLWYVVFWFFVSASIAQLASFQGRVERFVGQQIAHFEGEGLEVPQGCQRWPRGYCAGLQLRGCSMDPQ